MKYKTLCRLLVRLLGVYMLAIGVATLWGQLVSVVGYTVFQRIGNPGMFAIQLLAPLGHLAVGLYLFLGGRWLVDKLIPSNRLYCPECGYDVSNTPGVVCNECGTVFRKEEVEPHH